MSVDPMVVHLGSTAATPSVLIRTGACHDSMLAK